jgi:two-component system response regulator PilR (NtrC family)
VNCGAIPENLMESEFFGYKRGAFTGADNDKIGYLQAAEKGTLFLDEVGDLPLGMQVKLLRVIQEKSVRPVGGAHEIPLDVRILSATHKNLAALVDEGRFRHDLYYRINVIELPVPPLRERREDIPFIAEAVLQRLADETSGSKLAFSPAALNALCDYPFPGNVRELENILERAIALSDGGLIEVGDLALPAVARAAPELEAAPADRDTGDLPEALESLERERIRMALEACRYNKTKAAAQLGITFRALRYKLKKLEME